MSKWFKKANDEEDEFKEVEWTAEVKIVAASELNKSELKVMIEDAAEASDYPVIFSVKNLRKVK